jgi:hypothetical protein
MYLPAAVSVYKTFGVWQPVARDHGQLVLQGAATDMHVDAKLCVVGLHKRPCQRRNAVHDEEATTDLISPVRTDVAANE